MGCGNSTKANLKPEGKTDRPDSTVGEERATVPIPVLAQAAAAPPEEASAAKPAVPPVEAPASPRERYPSMFVGKANSETRMGPAASDIRFAPETKHDPDKGPFYAKLLMNGFPGEKDVVLIPDDLTLDAKFVSNILDNLGMARPNLIIEGVGSSVHPVNLLKEHEVDLVAFKGIMGTPGEQFDQDEQRQMVRDVMVNKLDAVTSAILQALQETGSSFFSFSTWMTSFDITCAHCMDGSGGAVVGSVQGIGTFHANDETISDIRSKDIIKKLLEHAVPLLNNVKDNPPDAVHVEGNYLKDAMFKPWEDHSCLTPDRENLKADKDRWPTSQWCNPLAQTYFLFFSREGGTGKDWNEANKVGKACDPMSQREMVAPPGMVFVGGHSMSIKDSYKQCFEKAVPALIIKYSGGLTNVYAELVESVTKILDGDATELNLVAEESQKPVQQNTMDHLSISARLGIVNPRTLLKKAYDNLSSPKNKAYDNPAEAVKGIKVNIADVVKMLDMAKARPQVFQHTIKVFDPLTQSQSQALDLLSECISSTYVGLLSLGANSDDILREAWMMRQAFATRSRRLKNLVNVSEHAVAILTWCALLSASLKMAYEYCEAESKDPSPLVEMFCKDALDRLPHAVITMVPTVLNALVVILPITTTLLSTMKTYFRFRQKWSAATMAAEEIESHIFQFRAGAGPYAKYGASTLDESENDVKKYSADALVRHRFSENLQKIYVQALHSEFSNDFIDVKAETDAPESQKEASPNVVASLLNTATSQDDGVAPLTGDEYYSVRFQQLKSGYLEQAPRLTRAQQFMNVWILVGGGLASLLGAFHMSIWIPVVVGFTAMLQHLLEFHNGGAELGAVNRAIGGLQALSVEWKGVSRMDRRAPRFKDHMVRATEEQHMGVIQTKTGIAEFLQRVGEKPEEDGNDQAAKNLRQNQTDSKQRNSRKKSVRKSEARMSKQYS